MRRAFLALLLAALALVSVAADAGPGSTHWSQWSRRAWRPRDLPGVRLWVDGDVGLALGTWTDQSGNGNDLLQASGTQQGSINTNAINGHAALTLDGVNDRYQAAFTLASPYTVIFLFKTVTLGTVASHDILMDGVTLGTISVLNDTTPRFLSNAGNLAHNAAVGNGTYAVVTIQHNGASSFIRVNGTQIVTGSATTTAPAGITLGYVTDGRTANVEYQAVIAAAGATATADIVRAESFLRQRAGL